MARTYVGIVHVVRAPGAAPAVERVSALGMHAGRGRFTLGYLNERFITLDQDCRVVFLLEAPTAPQLAALGTQYGGVCVIDPATPPPPEMSE